MNKLLFLFALLLLTGCAASPDSASTPKALKLTRPVYPCYALTRHIEGYVKFAYDVDAEGKVSEMRILRSEPRGLFEPYVIAAVGKWRYEPYKPVKNLSMTIRFVLPSDSGGARSTLIF
ncbi:TonB family protein [Candidatus Pantoea deserta]|uniref:Protein TonB n=1 Tax=Candidatus Pantoea deserta TaxID=1869313 RepID=A0A3N4P302_9GAMM|nr:TonB family protein [Pantoea deserta]RPE03022.1 TonB family protein [Pantoea deserta]